MSEIYKKLAIVQQKIKVEKGQYNKFGGYNYRSCEDILKAVKPLCEETKTTIILDDELILVGERYYIQATATISDGNEKISTKAFAREEEAKKGMDGSQITGSASSYARKYALCGLLAIDDGIDSDKTNTGDSGATAPVKKPATKGNIGTIDFNAKDKEIKEATSVEEVRKIYATIPVPLQKFFEEKCKKRVNEIEGN